MSKVNFDEKIVLVVENDQQRRALNTEMLTKHGYSVMSAYDPSSAVEMIHEFSPQIDMVVSNPALLQEEGLRLYHEIRDHSIKIPIVFLEENSSWEEHIEEGTSMQPLDSLPPSKKIKEFQPLRQ